MIQRMLCGDEDARRSLVEHNLRLTVHIARKYAAGQDMDDLVSCGTIGLIKAVATYDPGRGRSLATYASRCIENEILMRLRAQRRRRAEISLYEPVGSDQDGNEISLLDILADAGESVDDAVLRGARFARVRRALSRLDARERVIVDLRYGISNGAPMTQRETGARLGISRSYVSRIEKRALEKLRDALGCAEG